jgi:ABC-type uncharacterized transport system involved in gliding motility auxiliary subunit
VINRILNWVGWLGVALVMAAAAISRVPALERFSAATRPLVIAGLIFVLAYALGQWREVAKLFTRRQARYGTLAGVSMLVVLGILVAINYIGAKQNKRWDLTANKQFSLSDQSRNVLAKLDAPLQIRVFAQEPDFQTFRDKLKEYEYASKKVSTEYIDPDKKPTIATQNKITSYNTIVFEYKGRTERVSSSTEQDLTNGIIKVVSGQQRKVYFTQGHGEHDTAAADRDGYKVIADSLGRENYAVDKLSLTEQAVVPDDASVIAVAGPRIDFFPPEIDALKKYLDKAGKLLLMLDPPDKPDSPPLTNLVALAHEWGIDVDDDIVFDLSGMGQLVGTSEVVPLASKYPPHPITERFRLVTAYPLARSLTVVMGGVNGHIAQSLVETGAQSWAKSDVKAVLSSKKGISIDQQKDKRGPFSLAAAVSAAQSAPPPSGKDSAATKAETRVVVFGDSDFVASAYLGIGGNRDLFMNTIGWLSQQENLIAIRAKEPDDRRITLTSTQQSNIMWLSLLVIPGCIFGSGVYTWWRRR